MSKADDAAGAALQIVVVGAAVIVVLVSFAIIMTNEPDQPPAETPCECVCDE